MSHKRIVGLFIVVGFAIAVASAPASAGYIGGAANSCQPAYGSAPDTLYHDDFGTLNGSTENWAMLACPVAMGTTATGAANLTGANVQGFDRSTDGGVSCYFTKTVTTFGGSQYWSWTLSSSWEGTGGFGLTFVGGLHMGSIDSISTYNAVTLRCDLPPAGDVYSTASSSIVGYHLQTN